MKPCPLQVLLLLLLLLLLRVTTNPTTSQALPGVAYFGSSGGTYTDYPKP